MFRVDQSPFARSPKGQARNSRQHCSGDTLRQKDRRVYVCDRGLLPWGAGISTSGEFTPEAARHRRGNVGRAWPGMRNLSGLQQGKRAFNADARFLLQIRLRMGMRI